MPLPDDHTERMKRARLSLDALAIGDAFGEMLADNFTAARRRTEAGLMAGPWFRTDDTEMALSIFEVLHVHGHIESDDLSLRFAERYRRSPDRGYGQATRLQLRAMLEGENWRTAASKAFNGTGSLGNGGAMRIAPLGAYFAEDSIEVIQTEATRSAEITHAHREGQAGAIAVALATAAAWTLRGQPKEQAGLKILQTAYHHTPDGETRVGLARALNLPFTTPVQIAARTLGNGSRVTAPDTVPFTIWSAAKNLDTYQEALIETVSAGGDCDTNCAIVGGIVALYAGRDSIPPAWEDARERYDFELKP